MEYVTLANGVSMPVLGFGTYKSTERFGQRTLETALACGYRSFDTAALYRNEGELGDALAASGLARRTVFLSSKVPQDDLGYDQAMTHFERTLSLLRTDYLDLYLIHWPTERRGSDEWRREDPDTWRALEKLYEQGAVRAIGVSNFLPHHLLHLFTSARVAPSVNQIEFHPGYTQWYLVEFCRKHEIFPEAWSPMGRGRLLRVPLLERMAGRYGKSAAQLCVRFALQSGLAALPKASTARHMRENLDVFDFTISEEDMSRLATLPQCGWSGKHADFGRWAPELSPPEG